MVPRNSCPIRGTAISKPATKVVCTIVLNVVNTDMTCLQIARNWGDTLRYSSSRQPGSVPGVSLRSQTVWKRYNQRVKSNGYVGTSGHGDRETGSPGCGLKQPHLRPCGAVEIA